MFRDRPPPVSARDGRRTPSGTRAAKHLRCRTLSLWGGCPRISGSPFPPDRTSQAEPGEVFHAISNRRGAFASRRSEGSLRGLPAFPLVNEGLGVDSRRMILPAATRAVPCDAGPGARSPQSMRCKSAVASTSWRARVRRAGSRRTSGSASHHLVLSARAALTAEVARRASRIEAWWRGPN